MASGVTLEVRQLADRERLAWRPSLVWNQEAPRSTRGFPTYGLHVTGVRLSSAGTA